MIAIDNSVAVDLMRSQPQPRRHSYSVEDLAQRGRKIYITTDRGVKIRLEPSSTYNRQPHFHMYLGGEAVLIPTSFDTKESFRIKEPSLTEKEQVTLTAGSYSETHIIRTVCVRYR